MTYKQLVEQIKKKQSFLCVGLDTDIQKIPSFLLNDEDPIFAFNKQIIDHTAAYTVSYKPNIAFYEAHGLDGWKSLQKTIAYIKSNYPEIFIIADAKRGDIGNTSSMYARAFFENLNCDSITVAPYMGSDSVTPFLGYDNKWVILLALTSNQGAFDFQFDKNEKGETLYQTVLKKSMEWGNKENMMYVVGATKAEMLKEIRAIIPDHFLLVPGVGAQGGSLEEVVKNGINSNCGLLVNSSRGIIYADNTDKFAEVAGMKAQEMQLQMKTLLKDYGIN